MKATQVKTMPLIQKHRSLPAIQTTLYELMETVIDVADPEEGKLVNDVMIHILKKANLSGGRIGGLIPVLLNRFNGQCAMEFGILWSDDGLPEFSDWVRK